MARVRLLEDHEIEDKEILATIQQLQELTGDTASMRVFAHRPDIMKSFMSFYLELQTQGLLSRKLVELTRLGIAQINQCSACLSARYDDSIAEGLTEEMVDALWDADGSDLFTEREQAAIAFGQKMARDHYSVTDDDFARLYRSFSEKEVVELLLDIAMFIGIGRMFAVIDAMNVVCSVPTATQSRTPEPVGAPSG